MVDPVRDPAFEGRPREPHDHAGLAPLRVIERLRHVGVRRHSSPQLRIAAHGGADERLGGAHPELPVDPPLRLPVRGVGPRMRPG